MNASAPARHFSPDDLRKWLDEQTLAKAAAYARAVSQLHVSDYEVSALVQGSAPRPYTVRVVFHPGRRGIIASMHCTCPLVTSCKHCAATMIEAIRQRSETRVLPDPRVLAWVKDLRGLVDVPAKKAVVNRQREQLFYVLSYGAQPPSLDVNLYKARLRSDGSLPDNIDPWSNIERALISPPSFVSDEDLAILRLLWVTRERAGYFVQLRLEGRQVGDLLPRMLATGRCVLGEDSRLPLRAGAPLSASLAWRLGEDGMTHAVADLPGRPDALVLPTEPPWYVDTRSGECGALDLGIAPRLALSLLSAPPLRPVDAAVVAQALGELMPQLPRPDTRGTEGLREIRAQPQARLRLFSLPTNTARRWRHYTLIFNGVLDLAQPYFDYGGLAVPLDDTREFRQLGDEAVRLVRDRAAEERLLEALAQQGFEAVPMGIFQPWALPDEKNLFALASEEAWAGWMRHLAPALRAAGWVLERDTSFRHHIIDIDDFSTAVAEGEPGWLDVSMGFELEGRRIALAPILAGLLAEHPQLASKGALDKLREGEQLQVALEDGQRVRFPVSRIKPVLRTFIDLFDGQDTLRVSKLDAPRLDALVDIGDKRGLQAVMAARERLAELAKRAPVRAPKGLGVALRPYQLEGLAWLQTLRASGLAGILADDMGLGKTAQTLAHLLVEKQAERLDKPALVVLPTSLVFNWRREAARVAPALSVLTLHGPQRDFAAIDKHDIVLTTYPLVWRDADELLKHEFHLLILDEAQTVKNAASKAAGVVRQLKARHRLCLTGTPMENHLGELWAQFDFLLPGFLGDAQDFTRRWRTPIEKGNDGLRRELLRDRVKPFILRRRKDEVATELPPKSIVVRSVDIEGGQRDLYETVRAAMDDKVRQEVASKGFKRSQIVILDALLKLRQVCCDPRLLSLESAQKVKEHAKLELLMEMLPELVEEGRSVLLFSQFTGMLDLIAEALKAAEMPYLMLTGKTRNRESVVRRFQEGAAPLFLISLKAGGVGLNLTQADTVIHVDPWWNPAAEDQATDRAHRIGQTKPVFVYKLVVAGSIEERIVALQEKKSALAAAVLSGDMPGDLKFSEDDLAQLFAPLPDVPGKGDKPARRRT
ncbi:DEAD/DEAH box helicase [Uliginosibacterium sediminicola]|uniref:DEAD/DEAH box helicase n=1 Tax=Uliginosibacterium sediminicola TaxID=2024550 RepID=A0ABU9YY16_9RHOO